jgi:chemotaxis protein MotB
MKEQEKKPRRRVKKVKAHSAHHGGAWKVAYADFVTAMMALFLVLWLVAQGDAKLKAAIANYFRSPGVFTTMRGGILEGPTKVSKEPSSLTSKEDEQALISAAAMLQRKFQSRPDFASYKDQIKIDVTEEGLRIELLDKADRVSFSSGSAALAPDAAVVLAEIAHGICELPNPIKVAGHTDKHLFPPGSNYTNWELSADRANAARRQLEANCVKPEQIVSIIGYADTVPLVADNPYATANRRIGIIVMRMQLPASPDGEKEVNIEGGANKEKKDGSPEKRGEEMKNGESVVPKAGQTSSADIEKTGTEGAQKKPGATADQRLTETKLKHDGAVSVGEADSLPAHVPRARERREH